MFEERHKKISSLESNFNIDIINYAKQSTEGDYDYGLLHSQNTIGDPFLLGDAFETQLVNRAGETEVVDDVGETQAVDDVGESQAVDDVGETQGVDDVGESQAVDDVGETQAVDDVGESQAVDDVGETQAVDDVGESQAVDDVGETQAVDYIGVTQALDYIGETQALDDVGETQVVDHVGEMQVLDHTRETQAFDHLGKTQLLVQSGETQVLEDPNCMEEIMHTQLVDECKFEGAIGSDDGGTDRTQVFSDSEDFSDDESVQRDHDHPVHQENKVDNNPFEQSDGLRKTPSDTLSIEENKSGSFRGGFTSLRAASIRASGMAARIMASRQTNGKLCSSKSEDSLDLQPIELNGMPSMRNSLRSGREISDDRILEYNEDGKESRTDNRLRIGSKTARKLFPEDRVDEVGQSDAAQFHTEDTDKKSLDPQSCLAGLSYVDSQEPGELSQANALEVVNRFLMLNADEIDKEFDIQTASRKKSEVVSSAKGSRCLATNMSFKSMHGEHGIYDWDDNREDEGGGEFFLKKKELFFDGGPKQRPFTEPRRSRNNGEEEQEADNNKKLAGSDSKLMSHGHSVTCRKGKFTENLATNLNKQFNVASGDVIHASKTMLDVMSVGTDTQMAAEAMENLCYVLHLADSNGDGSNQGAKNTQKDTSKKASVRSTHPEEDFRRKRTRSSNARLVTRQTRQTKKTAAKVINVKAGKADQWSAELKDDVASCRKSCSSTQATEILQQKERRTQKRSNIEIDRCLSTESTRCMSQKKGRLQEQLGCVTSVAHRTRKYADSNGSKVAENVSVDTGKEINDLISGPILRRRRTASGRSGSAKTCSDEKLGRVRSVGDKQSDTKCSGMSGSFKTDALSDLGGGRTHQKYLILALEADAQCSAMLERPVTDTASRNNATDCNFARANQDSGIKGKKSKHCDGNNGPEVRFAAEANERVETSPRDRNLISASACTTPVTCTTPINNVSPICMGEEYHKQSCRKSLSRLSLMREVNSLICSAPRSSSPMKDLRKRRDITNIRVLFSQHLDSDVIKPQQKILVRLGASEASSMSNATHFVADEFVRTRNMLEAIAFGKPVVTHLWLESCGQARCLIDEKNYILRDTRKEKEFGFSMPVSLAKACQHPLLQGQRVLVTQNTKPGKEILSSLVKAVHGLAIERLGRSVLKDEKLPTDLLILSCEEDYEMCVPFLEKGASVYSSELLLNGIVTQKLEYERYRLFEDNVKRTRSTIWVKRKNQYLPVNKCK